MLEAADLIVPRLGLPDWVVTLLLVVLILGLPLVLALAWIFDVGPEGITRTLPSPVDDQTPAEAPRAARLRAPAPLTLALMAVAVATGAVYTWRGTHRTVEAPRRVVVLPFENEGAPDDEYFVDGMIDEVRGKLSGLVGLDAAEQGALGDLRLQRAGVRGGGGRPPGGAAALALAPGRAETHAAMGTYHYAVTREYELRIPPENAGLLGSAAVVEQLLGRWDAALAKLERAHALHPLSVGVTRRLSTVLLYLRRYPEALVAADRGHSLAPANLDLLQRKAMVFLARVTWPVPAR